VRDCLAALVEAAFQAASTGFRFPGPDGSLPLGMPLLDNMIVRVQIPSLNPLFFNEISVIPEFIDSRGAWPSCPAPIELPGPRDPEHHLQ
jgi:hypothetical protein